MNIKIGTIVNQPGSTFNGELQEKYNVIMTGWLARNEDGSLFLFTSSHGKSGRIIKRTGNTLNGFWESEWSNYAFIDRDLFPDVKWEDDYPTEVKIRIF